ncbi:MFS transporter [Xylariaceae sp. FL0804]|nr:MFS transporter [Xylariaceae sp. FL0804]
MPYSQERTNTLWANKKCLGLCAIMAMSFFQYGFDSALLAGFQAMPGFLMVYGYPDPTSSNGWAISTRSQQLISSCLNIGTIIGALATSFWAARYARRPGIWLATLLTYVAGGVQIGTSTLAGICCGRVVLGLSNGFFITMGNVWIVEVTPPHLRAFIGSFTGIWLDSGNVLGAVANSQSKVLLSRLSYRIPLACLYVVPTILSVLLIWLPESPRWLTLHGRLQEAEGALKKVRGDSLSEPVFKEEYYEMVRGIEHQREQHASPGIFDLFRGADRRRTMLCLAVIMCRVSSGNWLFTAYSTYFFELAGFTDAFKISIWFQLGSLAGTLLGLYCMFHLFGRRTMLLIGSAACGTIMLVIGIVYTLGHHTTSSGKVIVAFSVMFPVFFNGFQGTISFPISAEIVSSRMRVVTIAFATSVNYFASWVVSFCSPYFINPTALNWGPKYCFIWAGSNVITFLFFYFCFPEVKGRSLEEIDELFENRVKTRDFPKYKCISAEQAHDMAALDEKTKHNTEHVEEVNASPSP